MSGGHFDPFDDPFDDTFVDELSGHDAVTQQIDASEDSETLLRRVIDLVDGARAMPLSTSVLVQRDEVVGLVQGALDRLPDELRRARWLLREREEFIESRRREAESLLEEVRAQAERMVQRTEIVRHANQLAQRIVEEARDEARRVRHETEEFCDRRLARFEIVLERTLKTVAAGREKLQATPPPQAEDGRAPTGQDVQGAGPAGELEDGDGGFFDQDER